MRVDRHTLLAPAGRFDGRQPRQEVDRDAFRIRDGVLDRRLEPRAQIEDDVGGGDRLDLVGTELQVMRLDTRCGEIGDVDEPPADALRRLLHWIERRDDGQLAGGTLVGST